MKAKAICYREEIKEKDLSWNVMKSCIFTRFMKELNKYEIFHYHSIFRYPISQQFWMRKSPRKRPRTLQQFQVPLGSCWRQQSPFSFLPFWTPKRKEDQAFTSFYVNSSKRSKLEILIFKAVTNSMRTFHAKINLR